MFHPYKSMLFVMLALTFASAEQTNITSTPGHDVVLPCKFESAGSILTVKLTRSDLKPSKVLFFRDGHVEKDEQHPSFHDRVDLQDREMKDGNVSMTLKNVRMNDTGTYEWRIYPNETRTWSDRIFVYLEVKPAGERSQVSGWIVGPSVAAGLLLLILIGLACIYFYKKRCSTQRPDGRQETVELDQFL